uniref:Uncharacterized protein n=1 Tax=Timema shepardi TaxID=629360 RepID=A0A7R9FWR6_TIMSH|nr:unnamed protein product [Timema shepardi]
MKAIHVEDVPFMTDDSGQEEDECNIDEENNYEDDNLVSNVPHNCSISCFPFNEPSANKAKAIVEHYSRSPSTRKRLHTVMEEMVLPVLELIQFVDTRWSSEYNMLSRLHAVRKAVGAELANSENNIEILTEVEWKQAAGIVEVLGPLADATKEINKALKSRFSFYDSDPIFCPSMLCDPRFRGVLIDDMVAVNTLAIEVKKLSDKSSLEPNVKDEHPSCSSSSSGLWSSFDSIPNTTQPAIDNNSEVKDYLNEPRVPQISIPMSCNHGGLPEPKQKGKKKKKKKKGPIESEHITNDTFLNIAQEIRKEKLTFFPDTTPTIDHLWSAKKKDIQTLMREGSEVMAAGLPNKAIEKYRAAVDILNEFPYVNLDLTEMDVALLKYSLCTSWVRSTIYEDIVHALEMLKELEASHSAKLPAVHYALATAYCKLNRPKPAQEHVENGLSFLRKGFDFCAYPWPGTNSIIKETNHEDLEISLKSMLQVCRAHHKPDAVCRHENCLKISTHILPSESIFYRYAFWIQVGALPHRHQVVRNYLDEIVPQHWLGHATDDNMSLTCGH